MWNVLFWLRCHEPFQVQQILNLFCGRFLGEYFRLGLTEGLVSSATLDTVWCIQFNLILPECKLLLGDF
jgi:hypothetical protein